MVQRKALNPGNGIVTPPPFTRTVGAGDEKPMEYGEKNRPLHIELKPSCRQPRVDHPVNAELLPEPFEDKSWSYDNRIRLDLGFSRENEQCLSGKPGQGTQGRRGHPIVPLSRQKMNSFNYFIFGAI